MLQANVSSKLALHRRVQGRAYQPSSIQLWQVAHPPLLLTATCQDIDDSASMHLCNYQLTVPAFAGLSNFCARQPWLRFLPHQLRIVILFIQTTQIPTMEKDCRRASMF